MGLKGLTKKGKKDKLKAKFRKLTIKRLCWTPTIKNLPTVVLQPPVGGVPKEQTADTTTPSLGQ